MRARPQVRPAWAEDEWVTSPGNGSFIKRIPVWPGRRFGSVEITEYYGDRVLQRGGWDMHARWRNPLPTVTASITNSDADLLRRQIATLTEALKIIESAERW